MTYDAWNPVVPGAVISPRQAIPSTARLIPISMKRRIVLLALLACSVLPAQDQSVKPGINDKFLDSNLKVDEWMQKFETESREIFQQREKILAAVGLKRGMKVADIGAGTGLFTIPFAKAVGPEGKVYAVEIARKFLEHIHSRAQQAKMANVETVLCTERSVELPEASVDLAFICDVYHHFEFPKASLASLHKVAIARFENKSAKV
jgi:2-polyprenyl-3-methyl-5-hydroxy-6-metoxy-1,4-benzoquinol methylase